MKQEIFMEKLTMILSNLDFDEKAKQEALRYIPLRYDFISKVSNDCYKGEFENDLITSRKHYTRLMILIYKIVKLMDMYNEKGLPLKVMFDTLSDLTLRQKMYYEKCGKLGLNDEDIMWLRHIYRLEIFKLGSLQFEITHMNPLTWKGITYYDDAFKKVPIGTEILNVHIRKGVDFSKEAVNKSFDMAEEFFSKYFPNHNFKAYTCNSWMLYPRNSEVLSETSNILDFAKRFEIIGETNNTEFTLKFIFGGRYRSKKDYPSETSLQRNALKNINSLGAGCGILLISN